MHRMTIAIAALLPASASAQDCSAVIALSRISTKTISTSSEVKSNASNFCSAYKSAKSSGSSMGASASYQFLSGSFSSGSASIEEVASRYCSASSNYDAAADAYESYVNSVAPGAYDAYKACVDSSSTIKFVPQGILPKSFSMTVSDATAGVSITTLRVTTPSEVVCKWNGNANTTVTIKAPSTATLSCSRQNAQERAFVTVARTNGLDALTIPWQAYDKSGNSYDEVAIVRSEVASLSSRLAAAQDEISALRVETGVIDMAAVNTRPLDDNTQCPNAADGFRGSRNGRVTFAQPFKTVPVVNISFSQVDIENSSNTRAKVSVTNVDKIGFGYEFGTWCNSKIFSVKASWIATLR